VRSPSARVDLRYAPCALRYAIFYLVMHELSVTEQLLNVVLEHARKASAKQVLKVNVVVGDLTGFVSESIQFYFDILSKGTEAEKAALDITRIPNRVRCRDCKKEFQPDGGDWRCPDCGGPIEEVLGGRELYVESIEVE
jgi:hydrogenase nickel incorporation protein HypA/HybF